MLSSILAKLGGVENDSEIPEDISFLIRDVEELNAFERKLNMDKNLEKLTVSHLITLHIIFVCGVEFKFSYYKYEIIECILHY